MLKQLITPFLIIIPALFSSDAGAAIGTKLNFVIELLIKLEVEDYQSYSSNDAQVGQDICLAGNGSSCYSVTNIGQGICKAFNGSGCYGVTNTGQGICKAFNGSSCYSVTNIGQGICEAFNGSSCYSVTNIGQGICKAGNGSECYSVTNIGQGICKAGNGSRCYSVSNIGAGLCKARQGSNCWAMSSSKALSLPIPDTEWKWDKFRSPNSSGNIWACRGTASGRFAEDYMCIGEAKVDDTWPNN